MSDELAFFTTISSRDVVAVTGWPSVPVIQQGYCLLRNTFSLYDIIGQPIARDLACEHAFELNGPSLARSREARFTCPNRRACSQATRDRVCALELGGEVG